MSEALSKLRYSRFRHVYSKSVRRSEWYDTGPGHGLAVAANPKMIALAIDVPAGGVVQIAKLCRMGRGRMELGKIKDHEGAVCDVKWNPFNDNVLATGSHDATVRIWHIDDMLRIRCLRISRAHSRRVHTIEWHATVDNAVFSASLDGRIVLWNIETDEIVYRIEDCNAVSISLSYNCSEFVIATKSHELSIYDARTGEKQRSTQLIHDGSMLSRVLFYGISNANNSERIITTGNSRSTRRQLAIYNSQPLNAPLAVVDIDSGSGFLMPIIDNDLNLLYIAGKGDANIRFYELLNEAPFISYLNESSGSKAHTAVCLLPKRGLNILQCEIMRIFRVDAEQLVIEPLSFFVPRRADGFQADLYPPTRSPTPSLSFREWLAGLNREPIMLELKDCVLNCTNKPVTFAKESNRTKLIIADVNNDRKFRFLSQVTKPDYREITDREDREELLKIERIKAKLAAEAFADEAEKEQDMNEKISEANGVHNGEENNENENTPISFSSPISEKNIPTVTATTDVTALNRKNSSSSSRIANIIDRSASLFSIKSGIIPSKVGSAPTVSPEDYSNSQCDDLLMKKAEQYKLPMLRKLGDGNGKPEERGQGEDNGSDRSCFSEKAVLNVLREMENELWKCRSRCEQLEKIVHLQQQDIESLRYEIHWKDSRIDFLQTQLQQLDVTRDVSRSS
ncbi:Coronin-2A [Dirofilaria immitis]